MTENEKHNHFNLGENLEFVSWFFFFGRGEVVRACAEGEVPYCQQLYYNRKV